MKGRKETSLSEMPLKSPVKLRKMSWISKVYQKDKGKCKIGGVPSIKVTDNIPPLAQDTPPLTSTSLVHTADPLDMDTNSMTHDDTNPESEILFTMNVDTHNINIMVDKETIEVKEDDLKDNKVSKIPTHIVDSHEIEIPTQIVYS